MAMTRTSDGHVIEMVEVHNIGAVTDPAVTSPSSDATAIALLKGCLALLAALEVQQTALISAIESLESTLTTATIKVTLS